MQFLLLGDICQTTWNSLVDRIGEEEYIYWTWGPFLTFNIAYWVVCSFFIILDLTYKFEIVRKYKTQPGTNEPLQFKRILKVIQVVMFNQVAVGLPFFYVFSKIIRWRGVPPIRELPSISWILLSMVVFALVEEVGFYYTHRLLHHRHLYRHVHKQHHEWPSPFALTTLYCHPLEHLFSTLLPPAVGVFIMGSHVVTGCIMIAVLTTSAVINHCGYHLPFFVSQEFHDYHHLKFTECFGQLGILDRLHGTDKTFVKSGLSLRHRLLTSFTPMNVLHPLFDSESKS